MYVKVVEVDGDEVEADGELQLVVYEAEPEDDDPEVEVEQADEPNRSTRGSCCCGCPTGSMEPCSGMTTPPGS